MPAPTLQPKPVHMHGWKHRTAVVIDSHLPGEADIVLNTALLIRFLETIDQALGANGRRIQVVDPASSAPRTLSSFADLTLFYSQVPAANQDLPESIEWSTNGTLVGGGFPERWYAVGGPALDHDSFTFSVYSTKDIFATVSAATSDICATTHAKLLDVHDGKLSP